MTARRRWYEGKKGRVCKWMVDVDHCHPDGTRERVRLTSPVQTRRGAEQFDRDIRARLSASSAEPALNEKGIQQADSGSAGLQESAILFGDFSVEFLENYVRANNKPSEFDGKTRILERHLIPFFDGKNVLDIGAREIECYKALKFEKGLTAKTINNHLAVLGKMLRLAESWEVIIKAPKVQLLRTQHVERDFLSFVESNALMAAADDGLWRGMITLALKTGLRLGELRALERKDIDLERQQLAVRRAAWKDVVGSPKSGRHRIVDLSKQATEALLQVPLPTSGFIFADAKGGMLSKESCKWPLWRACDRAGLGRRVGWHALRHTFASHLVARGAPLKAVQELLGHSDIKMTMKYAHLAPQDRLRAVGLLDRN